MPMLSGMRNYAEFKTKQERLIRIFGKNPGRPIKKHEIYKRKIKSKSYSFKLIALQPWRQHAHYLILYQESVILSFYTVWLWSSAHAHTQLWVYVTLLIIFCLNCSISRVKQSFFPAQSVSLWHTQSEVADLQQQEYQISHSSGDSLSSATAVEIAFNQLLTNS